MQATSVWLVHAVFGSVATTALLRCANLFAAISDGETIADGMVVAEGDAVAESTSAEDANDEVVSDEDTLEGSSVGAGGPLNA